MPAPTPEESVRARRATGAGWVPPLVLTAIVVLGGVLPLVREPSFYFWDDTAAVFVPTWRAIGSDLLAGRWPTLRPDLWMGGNLAAEAQFGLWSPVNLILAVLVGLSPDLGLAAAVVKIALMLLLAHGAYQLMREYGAAPAWSVAAASALPFGGFTLYFDATTWVAGLAAFAWTPWFWWVSRRCLHARSNPLLVYVVGYLVVTNGNPYGVVAAVFVLLGLGCEGLLTGNWRGLGRLVLVGACVGTTAGVAYLPMLFTADAGWRGEGAAVENNGDLVPNLTMLFATSSPSLLPRLEMWGQWGASAPLTYTAWFLVPLAPWLPWDALRGRRRAGAALAVVGGLFLVLTVGPSSLWLFRWPVRLLQYAFLVAAVVVALLGTVGLRTDHPRRRTAASLALVAAGGWLSLAALPDLGGRHVAATALVAVLAFLLAALARTRPARVPGVLVAGTGAVLAAQLAWVPWNADVMIWRSPTSAAAYAEYGRSFEGPVVQLAQGELTPEPDRTDSAAELLFGSQAAGVAGVESTTSYTGIGFNEFSRALCLNHAGNACANAFVAAWAPAGSRVPTPHLLDAVKARTLVVQRALVPEAATFDPPPGWTRRAVTERVTVFTRDDEPQYPQSRLAATAGDVSVVAALATPTTERLTVRTGPAGGVLQFARLAWPGYTASVAGRPTPVERNAQGLIEVAVPGALVDAPVELRFVPPGLPLGIAVLLAGAVIAVGQGAWCARRSAPAQRPRRAR